ncbi:hypothetical protein ACGFIK_04655 [Micromonospora sp. NPDC048871]|uniref:hypothetical protein n=1 Tax=unclassified Micromonospora TaxID=2617518 RepID=UPI002E123625|nr:hypothetical protein OIE53_05730 [Micromonospora sp. NBC_01739]
MTEPEENRDEDRADPIVAPPTANPARVQVPAEGPGGPIDEGDPESPGSPPAEEG